jgi:hypothetical protein
LTIAFKTAPRGGPVTQLDFVTVDLTQGKITASGKGGGGKAPAPPTPGKGRNKPPVHPKKNG